MPSKASVFSWFRTNKEFLDQYTRAKEQSTAAHFEDLVSIADEDPLEPVLDKEGLPVPDGEGGFLKAATKTSIDHARLRIETRKWALAKLLPRKFGDRTTIDATVNDYTNMTADERRRKILELQQQLENAQRTS